MSFSSEIKSELIGRISSGRHCQLAEMAAIIHFCGKIQPNAKGKPKIIISESEPVKRKFFTLQKKAFNIEADEGEILQATGIITESQEQIDLEGGPDMLILKKSCCRQAYLRGAFCTAGSMSDPRGGYHLEFVTASVALAKHLKDILAAFEIDAKIMGRKKHHVIYIKDGAGIVHLLNIMGAHNALLRLESLRVEKEVRNLINRKVNCETANITKTITAAARQMEDIIYIKEQGALGSLSQTLLKTAKLRLLYPDLSYQDLGVLMEPPLSKSGVNHRLRKLSAISADIRHGREDENG